MESILPFCVLERKKIKILSQNVFSDLEKVAGGKKYGAV
jgi:hypothetical protein